MILAMLLLALQPGAEPPDHRLACAPRMITSRAGPPPPILSAQRMEIEPRARVYLSVYRCPDDSFRVNRSRSGADQQGRAPLDWVLMTQCPVLGRWIADATRLHLPSPMLRPHRNEPYRGTWFTLEGRTLTGSGRLGRIELEILHRPGAAPSTLSNWFRDGERLFQACRDQGHGGEGRLPARGGRSRP